MADISGRRDRNKKSPAVHYDMHRCTRRCDLHCFAAERSRRLIGRTWKNLRSKIFFRATGSSRLQFPSDTTTGQVLFQFPAEELATLLEDASTLIRPTSGEPRATR